MENAAHPAEWQFWTALDMMTGTGLACWRMVRPSREAVGRDAAFAMTGGTMGLLTGFTMYAALA